MGKHIKVNVLDEGFDIYAPREGQTWGYRYGPSIIVNEDNSIDAFFASPGALGEWDWFTYKHSNDEGRTWTDEVVVLQPTPDSMDFYSVCDPGVIKFGGYYYIGYTSTIYPENGGVCNNGFVARSKNPLGPYEKWDGKGWGGKPSPIVYFDEDSSLWGAGEFSFTKVDDILYIYYTWTSKTHEGIPYSQTRVSIAKANEENWPATIEYKGIAFDRTGLNNDSADVIYVTDFKKFVAITTDKRFSKDSMIAIYESDDGLNFTRVNELRNHIGFKCHNSGISGKPDKCVKSTDLIFIGYAYGDKWGFWGTRFHRVTLSLIDEPIYSEKQNVERPVIPWEMPKDLWPIAITTNPHHYVVNLGESINIDVMKVDTCYNLTKAMGVTFTNYDKDIISFNGKTCNTLKEGETFVTANYNNRYVEFLVTVRSKDFEINKVNKQVINFTKICDYEISLSTKQHKHIRGYAVYDDLTWYEIFGANSNVVYSEFDNNLIDIDTRGIVKPKGKTGTTNVKVSHNDLSFIVKVSIIE